MTLPLKPQSICASAWEGVVAAQYGLWHEPLERVGCSEAADWSRDRIDDWAHWTGGYHYTISTVAWLKCALSGCVWCQFLKTQFIDFLVQRSGSPVHRIDVRVGSTEPYKQRKTLTIILKYHEKAFHKTFDLYASAGDPAANYFEGRVRIPQVSAPHILAMAKTRIEECVRAHANCRIIALESTSLPKRLVDCSEPLRVRIVETSPHMRERYVALSYVWGGPQPHRTCLANLASYMSDGIASTYLPLTILDAICVTHALGIRFLWVDSLCIIQDSEEDKHRELRAMCNVYRGAYLTIDAGSAIDAHEGFLQDRDPLDPEAILPFICPLDLVEDIVESDVSRTGQVYVYPPQNSADDGRRWREDICTNWLTATGCETSRRGWCLQEALLSTRSLVFTDRSLQFRCQSHLQNVDGVVHQHQKWEVLRLPDVVFRPDRLINIKPGPGELETIHEIWHNIIDDYSQRSVTEPSDKLVACAAIAELFAPLLGPDYLAGLWRNALHHDLLWYHLIPSPSRRPQEYRYAPSWSWASVDQPVLHLSYGRSPYDSITFIEVVDCTLAPQNAQLPFGAVEAGGSLVLRAMVYPCHWNAKAGQPSSLRFLATKPEQEIAQPATGSTHTPAPAPPPSTFPFVPMIASGGLDYADDGDMQQLYAMPIIQGLWSSYGLIIGRADCHMRRSAGLDNASHREVYQRIGAYSMSDSAQVLALRSFLWNAPKVEIVLV
ncbi:heterokaryon incompatibility protein-domain-containing protein [Cubamyces lactineus]|nr:heterokaryon incompatibility protein-domain-containing protein [Cubamyces lactineus]